MRAALLSGILVAWLLGSSAEGRTCYANKDSACRCDLETEHKRLDLNYYDTGLQLTATSGDLYFTYSPCVPFLCNTWTDVQICMYNKTSEISLGLGRLSTFHHGNPWAVNSLSPLNFTIQYNDGDEFESKLLYSTVTVVYSENFSELSFLNSYDHGGSESYDFQLLTPHVLLDDLSKTPVEWIAVGIIGSWLFLVLVLAGIVAVIICSVVKYDRWKRRRGAAQYQPIPGDPLNHPT